MKHMNRKKLLLLPLLIFITQSLFSMEEEGPKKENAEYYTKAPKDMGPEDALVALYNGAKKVGTGWDAFGCDRPFLNKQKVTTLLERTDNNIKKVRGRLVYANFAEFPFIEIASYEKIHGQGSAKQALDSHWQRFRKRSKKKRTKSLS